MAEHTDKLKFRMSVEYTDGQQGGGPTIIIANEWIETGYDLRAATNQDGIFEHSIDLAASVIVKGIEIVKKKDNG